MMIYSEFCSVPTPSVLLSTNEVSRGFNLNGTLDWVARVDCTERRKLVHTRSCSRYRNSVLILMPLEMKMVVKLQAENIPIKVTEGIQNCGLEPRKHFQHICSFVQKSVDKEIFDVKELPFNKCSQSVV